MRNRRALSSVVGMVFAIIALTATIAYVSFSMNTLSQYNNAVLNQNQVSLNSGKERFAIASVTIPNGKFNITVANTGNLPINITKIWVQNATYPDWMESYVPSNGFVAPGGTVKNIGQSIPGVMYTTNAYYVKLVTSRGNTQAFTVNSASTAPLNIQLLTLPPTLPSGFTTKLVMLVTNNSTGVLANVVPQTPAISGASTASCSLGAVNPQSYSTLPVYQTVVFSWPLTISGNPGSTCTYTAQLQNGYSGNTASATVSVTQVSLVPATTYAQYAGIMTINYTTFRWTTGTSWNTGWNPTGKTAIAFSLNMTNNNSTAGATFYLSKNTLVFVQNAGGSTVNINYDVVNSIILSPTLGSVAYSCVGPPLNDYCLSIPSGGTATVYFYASTAGGATESNSNLLPAAGTQLTFTVVVYGKFASSQNAGGALYGQDIPFIGILSS